MTNKISIIMLTYNREKLAGRMIGCVLAQTIRDFEFIIVDNGSTDRSGIIADEYAAHDKRIRVVHKERGNIGSGRNAGLDAAKGEWITFVDDDDTLEPDYLEFLLGLAVDNNAGIAICGAAGREYSEKLIMTSEDAMIRLLRRTYYNVQFPTKLIRRELFDGVRFSETAKYDDIELFPKILAASDKIVYHGLAKYTFDRTNGDNNSAWTGNHSLLTAETLNEYLKVFQERTKWLTGRFPHSADTWTYFERSFWISMVEKVTRLSLAGCYELRDRLVRDLRAVRGEFISCGMTLEFEREWVKKYVK